MSDELKNISSRTAEVEFTVPQHYFSEGKRHILLSIEQEDFDAPKFDINEFLSRLNTQDFAVPEGYFLASANELRTSIYKKKSRSVLITLVTAAAAIWLTGILLWPEVSVHHSSFDDLIAESEIEPHDLLLGADEEEIFWAYSSLCDTLIADSTWVIPNDEMLDPRTGLPLSKSKQLNQISWDDISPADAMEYLREYESDENYYN